MLQKVIDQICGASVPFAELPTTVFGSLLRLWKMIGRARAYKTCYRDLTASAQRLTA